MRRERRITVAGVVLAAAILGGWDLLLHPRVSTTATAPPRPRQEKPPGPPLTCPPDLVQPYGPIPCPYPNDSSGEIKDPGRVFEARHQCFTVGKLRVTTGNIVAADPFVNIDGSALAKQVPVGDHPVIISRVVADHDNHAALLQVGPGRPVRWIANRELYSVDSGTGCFIDASAAPSADENEHLFDEARAVGYRENPLANVCLDEKTGANLIIFSSGAGDGVYRTYYGYAESGELVAVITDFGLAPLNGKRRGPKLEEDDE